MEQTLVLKGIGVFATLLGIYQWAVSDAQPSDIPFLLVVTVLIIMMDAEKRSARNKRLALIENKEQKEITVESQNFA